MLRTTAAAALLTKQIGFQTVFDVVGLMKRRHSGSMCNTHAIYSYSKQPQNKPFGWPGLIPQMFGQTKKHWRFKLETFLNHLFILCWQWKVMWLLYAESKERNTKNGPFVLVSFCSFIRNVCTHLLVIYYLQAFVFTN